MKFTGRMQGLKDAAPRRTRRSSVRRPNIHDADAPEQITLSKAQQDLLLRIEQNYLQASVLRAEAAADLRALEQSRLVDTGTGIAHLTSMGNEAARMLRERRGNPGLYDDSPWIHERVRAMPAGLSEREVRLRLAAHVADDDALRQTQTDANTRRAMQRSAWKQYQQLHPHAARRANPALAVLNPPRRTNASVSIWDSKLIDAGERYYRVGAEWDKDHGFRVVTSSIARADVGHGVWHDEKITAGYPDRALATAAAKERYRYLSRQLRRPNPALAVLNPLPAHLERFADDAQLSPQERADFNKAIAKYCEFHGVTPEDISITELDDTQVPEVLAGDGGNHFLVGMGDTEDVSYSANHKNNYVNSNKEGTPFRHEFPSKPYMATDPDGAMIFVINKPEQDQHFVVVDWIRG